MVSLCLMLFGGAGLIASVTLTMRYAMLFQMAALFLFIFSFEFFYRYEMTTFIYEMDGKDFVIVREVGKNKKIVCNLSMSTALLLLPTPKDREARLMVEKDCGKATIRYNHAQTMRPKKPYSVFFDFNGRVAEIIFEPNEAMILAMRECICENENDKN